MKRIFTVLLVITIVAAMMMPMHSFGATTGTPTVELTKSTYKEGEDIVGSYANYTSAHWGSSRADIVIYKKGDVVGKASNLGGYSVYNSDANKSQSGQASGTFTFPKDDDVRNKANFPLPEGEYFICLRADNSIVGEPVTFFVSNTEPPSVKLSKDTYKEGEDITGSYANYTRDYWGSERADIVIYKKGDVVGKASNLGGYSVYNKDTNKSQSGTDSGTFTFPADDDVRNKANFPLPEGEYFICLRADNSIVGEPVTFFVSNTEPPSVKLSKDTYKEGEDIAGSYANFTRDYWGSERADIVIYKKGDVVGKASNLGGYSVYNKDANKSQSGTDSGTFTFPADDDVRNKANFPLPAGEYYICLRADNSVVGETVPFKVVAVAAPKLTLSKTTFKVGEDINGTYENFTEDYWGRERADIVIYKKGDVVGQASNLGGYSVYNKDANKSQSGTPSGTFTLPADDDVRNKANFPLEAGEYFICLRADNSIVGEVVNFTVEVENTATGDGSLWSFAAITVLGICAFVMVKKRQYVF